MSSSCVNEDGTFIDYTFWPDETQPSVADVTSGNILIPQVGSIIELQGTKGIVSKVSVPMTPNLFTGRVIGPTIQINGRTFKLTDDGTYREV